MENNINIKRVILNNKSNSLVDYDQYISNPNQYNSSETVISIGDNLYPIINQTNFLEGKPGIFIQENSFINKFNTSDDPNYTISGNDTILDFSSPTTYKDVVEHQKMVRELRTEILTNSDNITVLKIGDNDSPAMVGLKESINLKGCDYNSYEEDFGKNHANNRRILAGENVSLPKLVEFGDAMDMKISITFEDKDPDVPNPMGTTITKVITGQSNNGGE